MQRKSKKLLSVIALIGGPIMVILGLIFIMAYILEAVVARAGEPDQSLLFWYLPFLLTGLIGTILGSAFIYWGLKHKRKIKKPL